MFSAIRSSSIRHDLLPTVRCPGRLLSISCITLAQFRNDHTNDERVQHADAAKVSHGRLSRRLQALPIASIRRIYKPEDYKSKHGETGSWTPQHTQRLTKLQLSEALERSNDMNDLQDIINTQVLSHEDGLQLLSVSVALVKALEKTQAHSNGVHTFANIIARLHQVGVEPNKALLIAGIQCAARDGSFEALARYLNIAASGGYQLRFQQLLSLLGNLHSYLVVCGPELNQSWDGRRRKQQILRILTGWQYGVRRSNEERQPAIFMAIKKCEMCLWRRYISILRIVGGKDVVFGEWSNFKRSLLGLEFPNKETAHLTRIAGYFAVNLIRANDAERAWSVIQDSGFKIGALRNSTWSMLLDYPQYIRNWQPAMAAAMAEKILKKYEECLVEIEATMGITWSGGEDGYHIASIQGETAVDPEDLGEHEGLDHEKMHGKAGTANGKRTSKTGPQRQVGPGNGEILSNQTSWRRF